jgi:1,4-alpha-glucan branching enzyme
MHDKFLKGEWFSDFEQNTKLLLTTPVKKENYARVLDEARALNRAAVGTVFMAPGVPMILDGDEYGEHAPNRFFAKYSENTFYGPYGGIPMPVGMQGEKGYDVTSNEIVNQCTVRPNYEGANGKFHDYFKELVKVRDENPALYNGDNKKLVTIDTHEQSKVFGVHRWEDSEKFGCSKDNKNEIYSIMNYSDTQYNYNSYEIWIPKGKWQLILNSDEDKFGGNGQDVNHIIDTEGGSKNIKISLPKQSILIYKKISDYEDKIP